MLFGAAFAAMVVALARRSQSLSTSGAIAALALGVICSAAGLSWAALLVGFFFSATLVSRFRHERKERRIADVVEKGGERDAMQVLANGGIFSVAGAASIVHPSPLWMCIGAGAIAASSADIGIVALKGTLDLGQGWFADTAQKIQANIIEKYAEYYLPGRKIHYNDVVVVRYIDSRLSADTYIVRYFARGYGLILERTITGATSEILNLQLIAFQGLLSDADPHTKHDHWYNSNGRCTADMKHDYELDK